MIRGVHCSKYHCLAWDAKGVIYSWGDATDGKLGHSTLNGNFNYIEHFPKPVLNFKTMENRILEFI